MLWNRKRYQILDDWWESLDYSLEAGGTPLFDIGLSHNTLDGLMSLAALQDFSAIPQQTLTRPLLTVGGNSPLWLLTLDQQWLEMAHPSGDPAGDDSTGESVPETYTFDTTFTAIDPATHMASLTVNAGPAWRTLNQSPKVRSTGLPSAVRALTFPQLEPAVISTWQALPLTMSLPKPQLRSLQLSPMHGDMLKPALAQVEESPYPSSYPSAEPAPMTSPLLDRRPLDLENDGWVSIIALVVVILLILVALLR